jgi:hypothetical protein
MEINYEKTQTAEKGKEKEIGTENAASYGQGIASPSGEMAFVGVHYC